MGYNEVWKNVNGTSILISREYVPDTQTIEVEPRLVYDANGQPLGLFIPTNEE